MAKPNQKRDAVLLRMLKTAPVPHKPDKGKAAADKMAGNEVPTQEEVDDLAEALGLNNPNAKGKSRK